MRSQTKRTEDEATEFAIEDVNPEFMIGDQPTTEAEAMNFYSNLPQMRFTLQEKAYSVKVQFTHTEKQILTLVGSILEQMTPESGVKIKLAANPWLLQKIIGSDGLKTDGKVASEIDISIKPRNKEGQFSASKLATELKNKATHIEKKRGKSSTIQGSRPGSNKNPLVFKMAQSIQEK